jgi:hypothetical protein
LAWRYLLPSDQFRDFGWNRPTDKEVFEMTALKDHVADETFFVVHPLFDEPEEKCSVDDLGKMTMSRSTRFGLMSLRLYLVFVMLLLSYHMLDLAGVFSRLH